MTARRTANWPVLRALVAAAAFCGCAAPASSAGGHTGQADAVADGEIAGALPIADAATAADGSAVAQDATPTDASADSSIDSQPAADAAANWAGQVVVHYPTPLTLTLRGNLAPLNWNVDMQPTSTAAAAATFQFQGSGPWQSKPLLAGAWSLGANYVVTPGKIRDIYPYFDAKLSAPRRDDFQMTAQDGKPRMVRVRLPAGYDENTTAHYPLLVMFDGQNVFDAETATFGVAWEVDEATDKAMAAAKLQEIIVAAVDHAGPKRIDEYTPWPDAKGQGGGGPAHMQWIEGQVLPALAAKYRILPGPAARTIGGSSLGGLMALYAAGANPQTWGGAIAMSGSWWWADLKMLTWIVAAPGATAPIKLWLDAGTVDDGLEDTQALRDVLVKKGWQIGKTLGYQEFAGANHSEKSWSARIHLPLEFFFDPGDRVPAF